MKKINLNQLIWFIILSGFTFYLYMLISTEKINVFIHPKMLGQVNFSFYGFALLTVFQLGNIFKQSRHEHIRPGFIIFMIPLILGLALNPKGVNPGIAAQKGVVIAGTSGGICTEHTHEHKKATIKQGIITLDNENFISAMGDISSNIDTYKGRVIILSGFVYKEDDFKGNEFMAARVVISCCAADAQVAGFMCRLNKGTVPANDTWVTIRGKVDSTIYKSKIEKDGKVIPLINVESMEIVSGQHSNYIYH